ncbi:hypothetical protein VIGAN_05000300 [Vigna angularis var. angularis]|uniref:Uncharacterized protein n=1 Tax=Vigna angularis var. angularis TaxID=157739 RepID=A0A0S3S1J5_PHAAN|nr:hypothetical protein VIGAN_05000300 [Vigna angularis var. angularis]
MIYDSSSWFKQLRFKIEDSRIGTQGLRESKIKNKESENRVAAAFGVVKGLGTLSGGPLLEPNIQSARRNNLCE